MRLLWGTVAKLHFFSYLCRHYLLKIFLNEKTILNRLDSDRFMSS